MVGDYEDRGALRGTPGSAYPQPEPNATELPSSAPGRPQAGCRSCASAPSPAAPAGVREEHYSRNARGVRNLGARNRDAAIVRCRCDDALGLPWCCSAHEREREGGAGAPRRTGRMNREGEGRSASSQRQRKSSRCQQRAHVCAVLRRFNNTSLNGYQPLVVIPLVYA